MRPQHGEYTLPGKQIKIYNMYYNLESEIQYTTHIITIPPELFMIIINIITITMLHTIWPQNIYRNNEKR